MNKFIFSIFLLLGLTASSFAQTNVNTPLAETVKTAVATNINQVMIEILSGTKDAAKEIYGASKEAIHKSIDFVGEQAPDVIKQFLVWRLFRSAVWALFFVFLACVFLFFSHKLLKFQGKADRVSSGHDNPSQYQCTIFFKWAFVVVAFIILFVGGTPNVFEMVEIKVAPKVYIIEYVVDLIHNK